MMKAMPARELETEEASVDTEPEPIAPVAGETEQTFTTEGDLPAIAQGTEGAGAATASELAFGATAPAEVESSHLDRGVFEWETYRAACEAANKPDKWKDYYRNGHTEAKGWTQPYEHKAVNDFSLKKGHSASEALQAFLRGPTITDYRAALLAEEIDEVRGELGDRKFDQLFGSKDWREDLAVPKEQRLRISSALYTTPLPEQMKAIAAQHDSSLAKPAEPLPAAELEARVEEKPESMEQAPEPEIVRQELGLEQADRQLA